MRESPLGWEGLSCKDTLGGGGRNLQAHMDPWFVWPHGSVRAGILAPCIPGPDTQVVLSKCSLVCLVECVCPCCPEVVSQSDMHPTEMGIWVGRWELGALVFVYLCALMRGSDGGPLGDQEGKGSGEQAGSRNMSPSG